MTDWWNGLTVLEQVFYYCAIPATIILVIQTIASILGIGSDGGDVDVDFDGDIDTSFDSNTIDFGDTSAESTSVDAVESASSLRFFSIRGIVAFFSLFGWVGVVLSEAGLNVFIVFFIATVCGLIGMLLIAIMFYLISKMQRSGNINIRNAIDQKGQVYLTIPANMTGKGKINVTIQERYSEINAMTKNEHPITTGTMVRVVDVIDINTLLVEKQDL
ncbi:MAG: hypothetical protein PHT02_05580 [Tissierellia bacterium]|nr:hypothetical protein [Tissierellia bacterium]